ncbi:MAG: DNRLRE domain-containing protein [Phycisphaerales bacterium]|nr:DNRLRE domain-containing protein [Phycisphaerales bacterium]
MSLTLRTACGTALLVWASTACLAETLITTTAKDNTLYFDSEGLLSSGAGIYMFAGRNASQAPRRAVMAFDLSAIPAGSTIQSVSLRLHMSRTSAGAANMRLHRLTRDWGEGESDSGEPGGGGAGAMPGDATWLHSFFDTERWTNAGGDFTPAFSAQTTVSGFGYYTWSGNGLVNDVQNWVNHTQLNAGWILIGPETTRSAKRFATHENPDSSIRPRLTINYIPVPEPASALGFAIAGLVIARRKL